MKRHILTSAAILLLLPTLVFARVEGQFDRTLSVSGAINLDLTTGSGSVMIKTGGANQVVIHARVHSNDWWGGSPESAVKSVESNPPIEQNGSSIRIGYNLPDDVKRHVAISYEITLPPDTTLAVNTGSGEISVEGVRARRNCTPAQVAFGRKISDRNRAWTLAAAAFMPSRLRLR